MVSLFLGRLAPAAFAAGVAHLIYQIAKHWDVVTIDFRFFWLAGALWGEGASPYDPAYAALALEQFGLQAGAYWYYPPNWAPLTMMYALADPLTGSRMLSIANAALLLWASSLNVRAFRIFGENFGSEPATPIYAAVSKLTDGQIFFLHAGFMATLQGSANTIHLGQSSILIYGALSLMALAIAERKLLLAGVGLALLMLKPQIGLFAVAALAFYPFGRRVVCLGALISVVMCAPALLAQAPLAILSGMATNLSAYADYAANAPAALTGGLHLAWFFGAPLLSAPGHLAFVLALCVLSSFLARRAGVHLYTAVICATLLLAALAPLHVYDLTIVGVFLLCLAHLRAPSVYVAGLGALILWRAGNLPFADINLSSGAFHYPGVTHASIAMIMIFCAVAAALAPRKTRRSTIEPLQTHTTRASVAVD